MDAERARRFRDSLPWLLALLFFLLRLPLLGWYHGEYTDSVILLTLFSNDNTYYPPLFTLLSWIPRGLGMDPTLAGRLVGIAAMALASAPLYRIGTRLHHAGAGVVAVLLFQSSVMVNRWAPRAMSDPLFVLLFLLALERAFAWMDSRDDARPGAWCIAWSGLATLTRYQGLALLPIMAICMLRKGRPKARPALLSLVPWLALIGWIAWRGFGHGQQYAGRTADLAMTLHAWGLMTWGWVRWLPYAMGYLNVGMALVGLVILWRERRYVVWTTLYLTIVWFAAHVPFQSFQFRYFLPILPLVVLAAARAWWELAARVAPRWRRAVWVGLAMWLLYFNTFSVVVLFSQREAFGDLWAAAEYLQTLPPDARIYANEIYGPAVHNYKLRFWSARNVQPLGAHWNELAPGDVVVLSTLHDDVPGALHVLKQRFTLESHRTFTRTLTPRMGDLMSNPPGLTSTPQAMAYRNEPQFFTTHVVVLE